MALRTRACRVDTRVDAWSYHMLVAAPPRCGVSPAFPSSHAKIKTVRLPIGARGIRPAPPSRRAPDADRKAAGGSARLRSGSAGGLPVRPPLRSALGIPLLRPQLRRADSPRTAPPGAPRSAAVPAPARRGHPDPATRRARAWSSPPPAALPAPGCWPWRVFDFERILPALRPHHPRAAQILRHRYRIERGRHHHQPQILPPA